LEVGVVDNSVRIFLAEMLVADPLIRTEQRNFMRDDFMHDRFERIGANILDNASDNIAFAVYCADHWRLARASTTSVATLVLVFVFRQSADKSFVNLNEAAKASGRLSNAVSSAATIALPMHRISLQFRDFGATLKSGIIARIRTGWRGNLGHRRVIAGAAF
jgi:hypothetical protein